MGLKVIGPNLCRNHFLRLCVILWGSFIFFGSLIFCSCVILFLGRIICDGLIFNVGFIFCGGPIRDWFSGNQLAN